MNNRTFPRRLAYLLWAHDLRKGDAAKELKINPATLSRWLAGGEPSTSGLLAVAAYFEVSLDWLNGKGRLEIY